MASDNNDDSHGSICTTNSGSGRIGRSWVSSPSAYSIAIQKRRSARMNNRNDDIVGNSFSSSPLMAIGGVGCYIDCYAHYGTISSTMKFYS